MYKRQILVIFTSWLLLGEPVTAKILWGVIVVVFGVLLLRFGGEGSKETNDVARALHNKRRLMKGFAFAIAAGCCWALSAPLTKLVIVTSGLSPTEVTFYRSFAFLVISVIARIVVVKYRSESTIPLLKVSPAAALYFAGASVIGPVSYTHLDVYKRQAYYLIVTVHKGIDQRFAHGRLGIVRTFLARHSHDAPFVL